MSEPNHIRTESEFGLQGRYLQSGAHRYATFRAACKLCSAVLAAGVLMAGALGKASPSQMLWAAAPLALLAFVEAGYASEEKQCTERLAHLAKKATENGGKGLKLTDLYPSPAAASISAGSRRTLLAVLSLSIWPFYAGLGAVVAAGSGAWNSRAPVIAASHSAAAPSCGNSCGASGGCGSGGCGASSGKGCACGGGSATTPAPAPRAVVMAKPRATAIPAAMTKMLNQGNRPAMGTPRPLVTGPQFPPATPGTPGTVTFHPSASSRTVTMPVGHPGGSPVPVSAPPISVQAASPPAAALPAVQPTAEPAKPAPPIPGSAAVASPASEPTTAPPAGGAK